MRQTGAVEPLTAEHPADLARLGDHDEPDIDTVSTSIVERANLDVRTRLEGLTRSVAVTIDLTRHLI